MKFLNQGYEMAMQMKVEYAGEFHWNKLKITKPLKHWRLKYQEVAFKALMNCKSITIL